MPDDIRILSAPLDPEAELRAFRRGDSATGAVVSFLGLMRDFSAGRAITAMTLEHYPGMTEAALAAIVEEAYARWDVQQIRVLHRVGDLRPQDPIVLVVVASPHRGDAFRACEFVIDFLKTRAPLWKKELTDAGERWVDARDSDAQAEARWRDA